MSLKPFHDHIRTSIANSALQAALDGNAVRRTQGSQAAFASLPDHQQRRARAHAVRAEVVAHLDEYLGRFIERVQANGMIVHHAANSAEAVEIVLAIAQEHNARLVAKSKSMISEEIELNHALAKYGIRAVETDLGEYIVQLRGERPSHIITPAVHLRRQEVGELFHEKLGIPYTEDIPVLTSTARQLLRQIFLTAEVGLSGVNFGVAETGTLCIVTNEGNGRMCTTVPPVHIALMGIERLLPTLDDLALFLTLLPRSATGQKLSVYTSLIHSPAPARGHRRAAGAAPGPGRQRTVEPAELRAGGSPVLHSLRGLPERLSGISRDRRACLPWHRRRHRSLSRPDRLGGLAGAVRPGAVRAAGSGIVPVRGLQGSLSGGHRPALPAAARARRKGGSKPRRGGGMRGTRRGEMGPDRLPTGRRKLSPVCRGPANRGAVQPDLFTPFGLHAPPGLYGLGIQQGSSPAGTPPIPRQVEGDQAGYRSPGREMSRSWQIRILPVAKPVPSLITQFTDELNALGGKVIQVTEQDLSTQLVEFLHQRGIESVFTDEVAARFAPDLQRAGIAVIREPDPQVRCGLTGVLAGIADTGSLVIVGGKGHPLTASLLPEIHLALLRASELLPSLPEALHRPGDPGSPSRGPGDGSLRARRTSK